MPLSQQLPPAAHGEKVGVRYPSQSQIPRERVRWARGQTEGAYTGEKGGPVPGAAAVAQVPAQCRLTRQERRLAAVL